MCYVILGNGTEFTVKKCNAFDTIFTKGNVNNGSLTELLTYFYYFCTNKYTRYQSRTNDDDDDDHDEDDIERTHELPLSDSCLHEIWNETQPEIREQYIDSVLITKVNIPSFFVTYVFGNF